MSDSAGELLPCPFCGGDADLSKGQKGDGSPWHYVECFKCASMAEPDVWSTRQPPQPTGDVGELVERLREMSKPAEYGLTVEQDLMIEAAAMLVSFNSRLAASEQERGRYEAGLKIIEAAGAVHGAGWCIAQARGYRLDLDFDQWPETGKPPALTRAGEEGE